MNKLIFVAAIAACVTAFADDGNAIDSKEVRKERILRTTGGVAKKPGTGKIVFINCQNKVSDDDVAERVDYIERILRFTTELRKGEWKLGMTAPTDAGATVYLVNDKSLPMSLIAPEAKWGVINTAHLDKPEHFKKEMARVFCLTAGGAKSNIKTSVMQTVADPADLDKLRSDGFTMDMVQSICGNLKEHGVTQSMMSSYRKACQEGWAPAPTNDYQKAVWDDVHAEKERGPKNALLIKP